MKNQILAMALFFIPFLNFAQTDTLTVNSKITEVTVFYNGAQISRTASVNLNKGNYQILLKKLPYSLNEQSIQVKNIPNCQILSVKMQPSSVTVAERRPLKEIRKQIEEKELRIQSMVSKAEIFDKEERLLWDNRLLSKEDKGLSVTQLKEAADFYRLRLNEISAEKQKLQKELKTEQDNILEMNKKINELNAEIEKNYSEIILSLYCEKTVNANIAFSYITSAAGWLPYYDFRVEEITDPLAIVYNANIFQSSGEDWKNVKIKLSGSEPFTKTSKPELQKWILERNNAKSVTREVYSADGSAVKGKVTDAETREAIPFANIVLEQNGKMINGATSDFDGNYIIKPIMPGYYQLKCSFIGYNPVIMSNINISKNMANICNITMKPATAMLKAIEVSDYKVPLINKDASSAEVVYADEKRVYPGVGIHSDNYYKKDKAELMETNFISNELQRNVSNLEYVIESPYTILSDGKDYAIRIKEVKKEVDYHYLSIPKVETDPFLICNLTNWQDLNLLDARYNIFFKGTFVGESVLNTSETNDTLKLSLGRDKSLHVSRIQQKMINDRKPGAKEVKSLSAYSIYLKNNKNHPIHIIIEDQYPVTERKSIDIKLLTAENAQIDEATGKLSWDLILQPNEKKELKFSYSVKYPQYISVDSE